MPILTCALGGLLPSWRMVGCWGQSTLGFSRPIRLLPEVEHGWIWFLAPATTWKAVVHRELEAAQTLFGRRVSTGRGEKQENTAFLSKHALGLSLVSRGEFHSRK